MNLSKFSCQHVLCQECFNKYIISTIPEEPTFPYSKSTENKYYDNPILYYHDTKIIDYFNEWNKWNKEIQKNKIEFYNCPICSKKNNSYIIVFRSILLGIILYYQYWIVEYIIWIGLIYITKEFLLILYY
jgi:hypothetical protein